MVLLPVHQSTKGRRVTMYPDVSLQSSSLPVTQLHAFPTNSSSPYLSCMYRPIVKTLSIHRKASCDEGIGWYVLVLSLCAMMCCCCFLTMARKFAAVWHERRWRAASGGGGDLITPLLDEEERQEQAHEVGGLFCRFMLLACVVLE